MDKVLSIIVPGYNIGTTIDKLMVSLLENSVSNYIEIIIVNDGSKDNTLEIGKLYKKRYPQIVRIIDKENGGHGSTLNVGIKEANGKYLQVIDGDDWVETSHFELLVDKLKTLDCDLILSPFTEYYVNNGSVCVKEVDYDHDKLEKDTVYVFDDVIKYLGNIGMVSIIYKTSLLKENHIVIDEKVFYDDNEFVLYPLPYVKSVIMLSKPIYVYRLGQQNQSVNPINYWKRREDHRTVVVSMLEFCMSHKAEGNIAAYIRRFVAKALNGHYYLYLNYGDSSRTARDEIKEFDLYLKNKSLQFYHEMQGRKLLLLRRLRFNFYKLVLKLPK